jgi:endoglucanase
MAEERQLKQTVLPRWRGFNILGVFVMSSPGRFDEKDFQLTADLGFDFVRLPLNYTFWIDYNDPFAINESKLDVIDEAVRWGEKYGLHVNLSFHRGPGYSVAKDRVEPFDLWTSQEALEAFSLHWETFAARYKGIPNEKLSFNLLNEPAHVPTEEHARVMRRTIAAIHRIDPERYVLLDGLNFGTVPMYELTDLAKNHVGESMRAYIPHGITHYRALNVDAKRNFPEPAWPNAYHDREPHEGWWDEERMANYVKYWATLAAHFNMGVHCGEGGAFHMTPQGPLLAWFEFMLDQLKTYNIGFAMWNLRGHFGLMDSERPGAQYIDFKGHQLDKKMYEIMKKY